MRIDEFEFFLNKYSSEVHLNEKPYSERMLQILTLPLTALSCFCNNWQAHGRTHTCTLTRTHSISLKFSFRRLEFGV